MDNIKADVIKLAGDVLLWEYNRGGEFELATAAASISTNWRKKHVFTKALGIFKFGHEVSKHL